MSKYRSYVFTLNNYGQIEEQQVQALPSEFLVYGREVGESGTPHLQGFIKFKNPRAFSGVKKLLPRAHIEICQDVQAAIAYCRKDGDVFEKGKEPEKHGGDKMQEKIAKNKRLRDTPLNELIETGEISIMDVRKLKNAKQDLEAERACESWVPHDNHWYWGATGTGKSRKAREENPGAYIKDTNKWWDGYQGQDVVIIEEWSPEHECLASKLKKWSDHYTFGAEIKGGGKEIRPKKLIITSNYPMDACFSKEEDLAPLKRRFKILHFNKLG